MNIKCFTVYICSINCPRVKWCPITLVTIQIIPYFEMNLIWSEKYTPKNNYENTAPEETEQTINQMTILLSWLLHIQESFWKKNEFAIITHDINKQVSAPQSYHCDTDRQTDSEETVERQTDSEKTGQRVRHWVALLHTELTGGIAGHICHPGRQKERKPLQSPA